MSGGYTVVATLGDPFSDEEHDVIVGALEDLGAEVERVGDDLKITYEAGGNVDAISHSRSLLTELQDIGLEAGRLEIEAKRS